MLYRFRRQCSYLLCSLDVSPPSTWRPNSAVNTLRPAEGLKKKKLRLHMLVICFPCVFSPGQTTSHKTSGAPDKTGRCLEHVKGGLCVLRMGRSLFWEFRALLGLREDPYGLRKIYGGSVDLWHRTMLRSPWKGLISCTETSVK